MFESEPRVTERGSPSLVGRGIANLVDFQGCLQSQKRRNTNQIVCYVRRYSSVLETGDASPLFLSKSVTVKRHAMEALTVYAKYLGCYDRWQQIRRQYSLHWTDGNESLQALERFFDTNLTLDSMLSKVKEMCNILPRLYGQVVLFACITGLRPSEACESVRLLNGERFQLPTSGKYYNPEAQTLEHFRFPDIFLRPTKKAYLTYLSTENYHYFANLGPKIPSWNAIRHTCRRRNISMSMHLCRKIFASYLRHKGIESEIVDLLQGRVSQSVLTRHYLAPSHDLKTRVLDAVAALQREIEK